MSIQSSRRPQPAYDANPPRFPKAKVSDLQLGPGQYGVPSIDACRPKKLTFSFARDDRQKYFVKRSLGNPDPGHVGVVDEFTNRTVSNESVYGRPKLGMFEGVPRMLERRPSPRKGPNTFPSPLQQRLQRTQSATNVKANQLQELSTSSSSPALPSKKTGKHANSQPQAEAPSEREEMPLSNNLCWSILGHHGPWTARMERFRSDIEKNGGLPLKEYRELIKLASHPNLMETKVNAEIASMRERKKKEKEAREQAQLHKEARKQKRCLAVNDQQNGSDNDQITGPESKSPEMTSSTIIS